MVLLIPLLAIIQFLILAIYSTRRGKMDLKKWAIFIPLLAGVFLINIEPIFFAKFFHVPTGSMTPTLQLGGDNYLKGDKVLCDKTAYWRNEPQRGEMVAFDPSKVAKLRAFFATNSPSEIFTFRIIGLPHERVELRNGQVFVNGDLMTEADGIPSLPYYGLDANLKPSSTATQVFRLRENEYLVLGDNSENSLDSRFVGAIPKESLYGKITAIVYPLNRMKRF